MHYQLLSSLIFFFLPVKIITNVDRMMEFTNLSITGVISTRSHFCQVLQSKMSLNESIDIYTTCFHKKLKSSKSKELLCTPTTIIYSQPNCSSTTMNQFNIKMKFYQSFQAVFEIKSKIFLTIRMGIMNTTLKSNDIEINNANNVIRVSIFQVMMRVNIGIDVILGFRSKCAEHYFGPDCETYCNSIDNIEGHYSCDEYGNKVCLPGWQDFLCSEAICKGCTNGQCMAPDKCECYKGWVGPKCTICQKEKKCKHGTCNVGTPFTCMCHAGWGGQHCDIDLGQCLPQRGLCQNNGTCYNYYGDSRMSYLCKCAPGYYGRNCEMKSGNCGYSICNSTHCLRRNRKFKCRCYSNFSGSYCQINDTLEKEFPFRRKDFKSDGRCVSPREGYSCTCSKLELKICRCKFIKCHIKSTCAKGYGSSKLYCSRSSNNRTFFEISYNFGFDNHSTSFIVSKMFEADNKLSEYPYLKFYASSFVFIPILVAVLILAACTIRFPFQSKSKASIKTIHNDLNFQNRTVHDQSIVQNNTSDDWENKKIKWEDLEMNYVDTSLLVNITQ